MGFIGTTEAVPRYKTSVGIGWDEFSARRGE
jgi:hypothetical protein